jgi:hypothetical protein
MGASICWVLFFLLIALIASSGWGDTPGDTNGLGRFFGGLVFTLPGVIGIVLCAMKFKRIARRSSGCGPRGFPLDDETRRP